MIRGQRRNRISPVKMKPKMNFKLHNRFDIEVVDSITGKVKQKAQAENIILNALWTKLLTPGAYFGHIHFGTGAGVPAATDTQLFTFLAAKAAGTNTYTYDWENGWISLRRQCQLIESEYVGETLSEVGIGYDATAGHLMTHAMLKDMNGNTITIEKTNTDIINIYATVFAHWTAAGFDSGTIKIVESPLNGLLAFLLGTSASPQLACAVFHHGAFQSGYCGAYSHKLPAFGAASVAYSIANKTITVTAARVAADKGNILGLNSIALYYTSPQGSDGGVTVNAGVMFNAKGGSWFSGSSIVGEAIGTGDAATKDFKTVFAFVKAGAKIYVDAIEQVSGVTVDVAAPSLYNNMGYYFEPILPLCTDTYYSTIAHAAGEYYGGGTWVLYNPYYTYGILSYAQSNAVTVWVSDDLTNWVSLGSGTGTKTVDAQYRQYKYWKFVLIGGNYYTFGTFIADTLLATNIHFDNAPANGAVITADYSTDCIAKDADHVFDFSTVITLAEHA